MELRGTAPTYAAEAQQFMDDLNPGEALEKIDYAIQQVPNEATYHNLARNILQAQLRLDEAVEAYEQALALNPEAGRGRAESRPDTKGILMKIGTDEQIKPAILAELYSALINQGRRSAAENIENQFGLDKQRLVRIWRDTFDKRGLRRQRFETNADNTINVDFSKVPKPELEKLRDVPVSGLNLEDTKIADITALARTAAPVAVAWATPWCAISRRWPGMPLRNLNLESSAVTDLAPAAVCRWKYCVFPIRGSAISLRWQGTKIEQLYLSACRDIKDLTPLRGLPLQTLTSQPHRGQRSPAADGIAVARTESGRLRRAEGPAPAHGDRHAGKRDHPACSARTSSSSGASRHQAALLQEDDAIGGRFLEELRRRPQKKANRVTASPLRRPPSPANQ